MYIYIYMHTDFVLQLLDSSIDYHALGGPIESQLTEDICI